MAILTGDKKLDKKLGRLARRGANRVARRGLGKALTVLARAMRAEAPNKTMKASIGKRNKKNRRKGIHEAKVGPNVGNKGKGEKRTPHAHLFILGTKERFTKTGASRGAMPQNDFVRRAAEKSRESAAAAMKAEIRKQIKIEASKR